jgi:N-acetylmuramoyl-L-alanine amidase
MRDLLRAKGFRVVLTKDREEQMVTNRKRATISNEAHADLLVRLHCDAGNKSGFAVYYPDRQGTAGGVTGPSQQVLNATLPIAQRFYKALTREMNGALTNRGLLSDTKTAIGAKQGALTGSIFSTRPVVLVEMVVLTNPKDEAFIGSAKGLSKMATALANAASASIAPTHTLHK